MKNKYTFEFTFEEMKLIRSALLYESLRREDRNLDKVEEYDDLIDAFSEVIRSVRKENEGESK